MSTRNADIPKTWEESSKRETEKALIGSPKPQRTYKDIKVFPYGYTDPLPLGAPLPVQKPANPKRALAEPLPTWAPEDYKRLHLYNDYLPVNATKWQLKNLFEQIHHHFGGVGAHVFETLGLQGILPTTRWPIRLQEKVNDTYYRIRMRDNREKKERKKGQPHRAFIEFLAEHKNNYNVAFRVIKKKSEFETARWCCFNDHSYLNEQEPFKGKVDITNYNSGYSRLNHVKVWSGMFLELFDFLYKLYDNPKRNTKPNGERLLQTFFVVMFEGKRFPAIEKFTHANVKQYLQLETAPVLNQPLQTAVNTWSGICDLLYLLAIVLQEEEIATTLMALKPNSKDPKKPRPSLIPVFEQFRRHKTKAMMQCQLFASEQKGLQRMLQLRKDRVSSIQNPASYGRAAYERLRDECLNLLMFNRDHVLALKARESGFEGLLGVALCSEKPVQEPSKASSSGAATGEASGRTSGIAGC